MKKLLTASSLLFAAPLLAFAQTVVTAPPATGTLLEIVADLGGIVTALIPILLGLALVVFFWGLIRYMFVDKGGKGANQAKSLMLWGLIALFVMVSVMGIIRLAQGTLGVGTDSQIPAPTVQ